MATGTGTYTLSHLRPLEVESSHILREVAAEFERPGLLYSVGKDSSDLLRAGSEGRSAVHPGQLPFPLMHVDTGFKFGEMCEFRGRTARGVGGELIVWRNEGAIADRVSPFDRGTRRCCGFLKTEALLTGLRHHGFDAAIGGARRDKEKSRAKERVCSFRDAFGQWDPRRQRPELWNLYNARSNASESIRVFPPSSWTEQEERGLLLTTRAGPLLSASPKIVASDGGKELAAIGSVDDGKSTRIGRLLDDPKSIYEDQLSTLKADRVRVGTGPVLDLAVLTDGLKAEREQGIMIDVAHRYFTTARRHFIIADTPGHEQYTCNMVTGASTANLAVILIDARRGSCPRRGGISSWRRLWGSLVCGSPSTRWTWSTFPGRSSTSSWPSTSTSRRVWASPTSRSSRSAPCTAETWSTAVRGCPGTAGVDSRVPGHRLQR